MLPQLSLHIGNLLGLNEVKYFPGTFMLASNICQRILYLLDFENIDDWFSSSPVLAWILPRPGIEPQTLPSDTATRPAMRKQFSLTQSYMIVTNLVIQEHRFRRIEKWLESKSLHFLLCQLIKAWFVTLALPKLRHLLGKKLIFRQWAKTHILTHIASRAI